MVSNQPNRTSHPSATPPISIVLPAHNEEQFIGGCLASLLAQDYRGSYEVVVVDNGSTDGTARIARERGVRIVPCPVKGVIPARQTGAFAAKGELIVQADADTLYPKNWLTRIAAHFASHPQAVAVGGRFVYSDPPHWAFLEYALRILVNFLSMLLWGRPLFVSGANIAFRRDAFMKVGGYKADALSPDQLGIANRLLQVGRFFYDWELTVATSSRRVQKPFHVILGECLRNSNHAIAHAGSILGSRIGAARFRRPKLFRTLATSVPLVLVVGFASYGYFVPGSQVFGPVYYQNKAMENTIALTFDDGPNDPYTSQVLDLLKKYNVKATFFLIGKNVELSPETAQRILAEGHVIGNHSQTHDANHALYPDGYKDVAVAQDIIYQVTGVRPHLYRPPHGKKTPWELYYIKQQDMVEVTWSISTNEIGATSPEAVARQLTDRERNGRVILLHDGYGTSHNVPAADKSLTVKALPLIIEVLQEQGYRFVTVPQLFNVRAYS